MEFEPTKPAPATIGDPLEIAARVTNNGVSSASARVQLVGSFGNEYEVLADVTLSDVMPGAEASAVLNWDTTGADAGVHGLILALVSLDESTDFAAESFEVLLVNEDAVFLLRGTRQVNVGRIVGLVAQPAIVAKPIYPPTPTPTPTSTPTPTPTPTATATPTPTPTPPPRVDAEIVSVSSNPSHTATRGEWVEISVAVRNNGNRATSIGVQLTFPSETKRPETKTTSLDPGQTRVATFIWKTLRYDIGVHTLRVDLMVDDNTTLGDTSAQIALNVIEPVIEASIQSILASPDPAVVGEPVAITVSVRNEGAVAANIPITLHFPSADKKPETRKPRAEPGGVAEATFTWRTSRYEPGIHSFRVSVPGSDRYFTVVLEAPAVDFGVFGIQLQNRAMPIVQGDWVVIKAEIRNVGPHAGQATVALRDQDSGAVMYTDGLSLEPQESRPVEFTWKTLRYELREYRLQVHVESPNDLDDANDLSDTLHVTIVDNREITLGFGDENPTARIRGSLSPPNIPAQPRFSIADISFSPEAPVKGEPVTITIRIRNVGGASGVAPVTLHFPSAEKEPESRRPRIGAGAEGSATFTWRTGRYAPAAHSFRVRLLDVTRIFTIQLLPPTVDFAVIALYPPHDGFPIVKGDWVEVAAFVQNFGSYDGSGTVRLHNLTHEDVMYTKRVKLEPGESRFVEFTWKTLRYELGDHRLLVSVDAQYDGNAENDRSQEALATIFNHRDITVGFGAHEASHRLSDGTVKPRVYSEARYPDSIIGNHSGFVVVPFNKPLFDGQFGVERHPPPAGAIPAPSGGPVAVDYRTSASRCAQHQWRRGDTQPRAVLCPRAPPLVR